MKKNEIRGWLLAVLITTVMQSLAQQPSGIISGTVVSGNRESLSGATILLKGAKTRRTASGPSGNFTFKTVAPGSYDLSVSFLGFITSEQKIQLSAGETRLVNISLEVSTREINGVIVTTQKRTQQNIEVPITISALSGKTLKNLNITEMDALSQYVPGLQVQIQSPNNASFVIRGVTSDDGDSRVQQRVSIFQDGVSISKARGSVVELYDMERVEVAKGPQGTLFGRSAENGAIHLIQNKPVNNTSGELALGYGNYNQKIANGFYNTPIAKDKLLNRFAFAYNERDGFIKNVSGGTLNGKNTIALRDILRYLPDSRTTIDLILNYEHDNPPGTSFKSGTYAPKGGNLDPNSDADLGPGKDLYIHRDVWGPTLLATRTLSDNWSATSITAFRHFNTDESFNADGTAARVLWFHEKEKDDQFSQEFRFNYSGKGRLSGFLGASYFYENGYQQVPLQTNLQSFYTLLTPIISPQFKALTQVINALGAAGAMSPANQAYLLSQVPVPVPLVSNGVPNYTTNLPNLKPLVPYIPYLPAAYQQQLTPLIPVLNLLDGSQLPTSYSEVSTNYNTVGAYEIFADGTYKVTNHFSVTAGIRGTYEHQTGAYSSSSSSTSGVLGYMTGYYPNLISVPTEGKKISATKDYFSYTGRLAVNYLLGKNSVYASISRGRRPGVIDNGDAADTTIFLQPEIVWSYEAGIKGRIGSQLYYDFAVFYYNWDHFQSNILNTTTLKFEPEDAGKAHSFGIETGWQYYFGKGSSFFANYGYIDGRFNDKSDNGEQQQYAGNTFRLTPKHTFSAGVNFVTPLSRQTSLYIRPSYTYKSKVYFEDTPNADSLSQSGYGLVNLNAGVVFGANKLKYDISFFSKNLFDKKYLIDGGNTGELFGIPTYIGGTRLTYGIQVKVSF